MYKVESSWLVGSIVLYSGVDNNNQANLWIGALLKTWRSSIAQAPEGPAYLLLPQALPVRR